MSAMRSPLPGLLLPLSLLCMRARSLPTDTSARPHVRLFCTFPLLPSDIIFFLLIKFVLKLIFSSFSLQPLIHVRQVLYNKTMHSLLYPDLLIS